MSKFNLALEKYREASVLNGRPDSNRITQLESVTNILNTHFPFEKVYSIETGGSYQWVDGMVGYYFAFLSNHTEGEFYSVDINPAYEQRVYDGYKNIDPNLKITHVTDDSLNLLRYPPFIPNLVHLDSWDVDLKNPFPSALHGWREFEAIESSMPIGSIIIIDDNWYAGSWVEWFTPNGKGGHNVEIIYNNYPCIGKGTHIYQQVIGGYTDWNLLESKYKIIIQKVK